MHGSFQLLHGQTWGGERDDLTVGMALLPPCPPARAPASPPASVPGTGRAKLGGLNTSVTQNGGKCAGTGGTPQWPPPSSLPVAPSTGCFPPDTKGCTWRQGLLQLLGLLLVRDDQGVQVPAAAHLEFHIVLVLLDLDRCGIKDQVSRTAATPHRLLTQVGRTLAALPGSPALN